MGKGKQRNSRNLKMHQIPDDEMETVVKDYSYDEPEQTRPPKLKITPLRSDSPYHEGDVVTVPGKAKNDTTDDRRPGTVFAIMGNELLVLDAAGFIHRVYVSELGAIDNT